MESMERRIIPLRFLDISAVGCQVGIGALRLSKWTSVSVTLNDSFCEFLSPDSQIDSLPISTCVALAREVASLVDSNDDDAEKPGGAVPWR